MIKICILIIIIIILVNSRTYNTCTREGFIHTKDVDYNPANIKSLSILSKKPKVLVYHSIAYNKEPEYMKYSTRLNKKYCNRWGYDFKIINHDISEIPPYWLRVKDLVELLKSNYDIICYMDVDAAFNDHDIELTQLLKYIEDTADKTYDIFIGSDVAEEKILNSGVFIVKNNKWTRQFIKTWLNNCIDDNGNLQGVCESWIYNNNKWNCNNCVWAGYSYEQGNLENMYNKNILNAKNHIAILDKPYFSNRNTSIPSYIRHLMNRDNNFRTRIFKNMNNNMVNYILLNDNIANTDTIPKVVIQTYYDKSKIPNKVYENIKKYASGYKHIIYDDNECIAFFNKHYKKIVVDTFNSLVGAHKADLFRYCYLYIHGGVYLDIKTVLIKDIDTIFTNKNTLYTVINFRGNSIYQGVIATPPGNNIFLKLIDTMIYIKKPIPKKQYHFSCIDMFNIIRHEVGNYLQIGDNFTNNKFNYHLFKEQCVNKNLCVDDIPDRYNVCCNIYDEFNNKIIKTRYSDFPW